MPLAASVNVPSASSALGAMRMVAAPSAGNTGATSKKPTEPSHSGSFSTDPFARETVFAKVALEQDEKSAVVPSPTVIGAMPVNASVRA